MTYQKRKRAKSLSYFFGMLLFICTAIFSIVIIGIAITHQYIQYTWPIYVSLFVILLLLFTFLFLHIMYRSKLIKHDKSSYIKKIRKFKLNTIRYLENGDVLNAINEYAKYNHYPNECIDNYVYGMLILSCRLSNIKEIREKGKKVINDIKQQLT